jgi:hypothetical protein
MAFEPKTWKTGSAGGTPITAADLNRIEQGISNEQVGPKGDTGDAGAPGTPGTAGAKGDKGDKGDTGAPGFPTQQDWDALVARVTALETP